MKMKAHVLLGMVAVGRFQAASQQFLRHSLQKWFIWKSYKERWQEIWESDLVERRPSHLRLNPWRLYSNPDKTNGKWHDVQILHESLWLREIKYDDWLSEPLWSKTKWCSKPINTARAIKENYLYESDESSKFWMTAMSPCNYRGFIAGCRANKAYVWAPNIDVGKRHDAGLLLFI